MRETSRYGSVVTRHPKRSGPDVTLVAQPMNPSVGGLTTRSTTDAFNLSEHGRHGDAVRDGAPLPNLRREFVADVQPDRPVQHLGLGRGQDRAGNTDAVAPSDVAFLDTTADVEGDQRLGRLRDQRRGVGTVQIAISVSMLT